VNDTRRGVLDAIADGAASGPEMADRIGVSRTAVWKAVEALREEGFGIEAGEKGYVLTSVPEYGAGAVEHRLDGRFSVEYHDSVPSTNARARELAREGRRRMDGGGGEGASDVIVLADEQTGGRGRLDRKWVSPAGGVWMSVLVRPDIPPARAPLLTLAAAVATARAVDGVGIESNSGGPSVGLKWPNDVLAIGPDGRERKLAGVLTEMEGEAGAVSWIVVGIGVNANVDASALPAGATSLRELCGDVDRGRFVAELLEAFDGLRSEPGEILPAWRDRSLTLGRRVRIEGDEGVLVGEAAGIEPPGSLLVDTGSETVAVHAGDCEHLRREDDERHR
jgi:BirA family biotin operon repressor/biotin-[acetyl-CoA-carboxylase] ligase